MIARTNRLFAAVVAGAVLLTACEDDGGTTGPGLTAPTNIQVTALSQTSLRVTWGAVSGATGYRVERAPQGGNFASVGTPTEPTFDDTGLSANTTYRYRVAATAAGDQSSFSSEANGTTSPEGPKAATLTGQITADRTLFADTVYTLQGFVQVVAPATLTIQAGTKIVGDYETVGSSLFILRGARIRAMGTAGNPIVFTSERAVGQRQPGDWGGLILIGNARINRTHPVILEGTENFATPLTYSGGTDDADNSGELHYVRVEFAGYATADAAELNSFTFAAVGSGTQMDHLQSMSGLDDSFEWFGGGADAKYLVSYESGDDHFDMSEGFSGRLQYLIAYQSKVLVPRTGAGNVSSDPQGIENDGCGGGASCPNGEISAPLNLPMVANFTLIGTGPGLVDATSGGYGMILRRGTGGFYVNGVVARWPKAALGIRESGGQTSMAARLAAGDLAVQNVLSSDNAALFQAGQLTVDAGDNALVNMVAAAPTLFALLPANPSRGAEFDWTPSLNSAARTGGMATFTGAIAAKAGTFISGTSYRGAVDPNGPKWWNGWTSYADN
jgi:hypothetical protein